jgi:hypothetical protein
MDAGPHPDIDPLGPGTLPQGPLDRQRGLERRGSALEDREELIRARVDLAATRAMDGAPEDGTDLGEKRAEYAARVGGMLREHVGGRRFRGTVAVIYERTGLPVVFVPVAPVPADCQFLDVEGEGTVCLW